MKEHEGRVALVTGAGSGIGRAIAEGLAAAGARVIVQDRVADRVDEAVSAISGAGGKAEGAVFDVRDESAMQELARRFPTISLLVNNAGIGSGNVPIEAMERDTFDAMMGVHVWGAVNAVCCVVPGMKAAGFGRIVNIASNRGQVGFETSSHYAGAKAALIGFAKAWARELAPFGILVNAVAPGVTRSAMTLAAGQEALAAEGNLNLLKRWAEPEEIAAAVLFALGAGGSFMTGQVLCPNGGDPIVGI